MRTFKIWYLNKCIALCNYCLSFSDGADTQGEVNEVVSLKNYFIKELGRIK